MDDFKQNTTINNHHEISCPQCGGGQITTSIETEKFNYGRGSDAFEIQVQLPVRNCKNCEFQFLDDVSEEIRHEAVCRHLGVLTPVEVSEIRKKYNLNRQQFSKLTKIGEASLARWEAGSLIQSQAYDQFLYLLTFEENLDRIIKRLSEKGEKVEQKKDLQGRKERKQIIPKLRMIHDIPPALKIARDSFKLHPVQKVA